MSVTEADGNVHSVAEADGKVHPVTEADEKVHPVARIQFLTGLDFWAFSE